jgi:Alpha/beta hydrolase of unknown function (DUF900)
MKSKTSLSRSCKIAVVFAFLTALRSGAQILPGGEVSGTASTSSTNPSTKYTVPAKSPAILMEKKYEVFALPPGYRALGLGDNGVSLLLDFFTGIWLRWEDEEVTEVERGSLTKAGEILRGAADVGFTLEKEDGSIVPLNIETGGFPWVYLNAVSRNFAVGYLVNERDELERPVRETPVKWNLSGGYQTLGPTVPGTFPLFHPARVNDRGDCLAWQYEQSGDDYTMKGTYINDHYIEGYEGADINNHGAAILMKMEGGGHGHPYYWDGSLHPIGEAAGLPGSLTDNDEMIVLQEDGRTILWQKSNDADGQVIFIPTDLADLTGLKILLAVVNNAGEIAVETWSDDNQYFPQDYVLVPSADRLGVDFDRNGAIDPSPMINNPDRELERRHLPWHFWVNDDNDSGEIEGSDIPGRGDNGQDNVVNGVRDLVDFFPVHLNIRGLLKSYAPSDPSITYKLTQADEAANFLTTELTPQTAGDFQRNAVVAGALGGAAVTRITAAGIALDRTFLDKITTEGKGIILVEARRATDKPLKLEVWRGNARLAEVSLPLSFASVETMFRHKNLTGAVRIVPQTADRPGTPNWPDELNNGKAFVFVHGYNVNQQQARGWQAEFFKRLWWSGSKAQFWGVTWYGSESQVPLASFTPNYHLNVTHAFGTAPVFTRFLTDLRASGRTEIQVAAHSLGNMMVSSAISDYAAPVAKYFMIDAAVAVEAYDSNERQPDNESSFMPHSEWNRERGAVYPPRLWASNWHQLFQELPNDSRAALTWHDRFAPRAGTTYYDFYSSGEEVLGYDTKNTPSLAGVLATELSTFLHITLPGQEGQPNGYKAWVYQEQLKGRTVTGKVLGSTYGGWGFNRFHFKKQAGGYNKGPSMTSTVLSPSEANALSQQLYDDDLRAEPFFKPGANRAKVSSWKPDGSGGQILLTERLGALYNQDGSGFAARHRDTLLARMVPAISPPAGRELISLFGFTNQRNFDMSSPAIRGDEQYWPSARNNKNWLHSDLRQIAYTYVRGLYDRIVQMEN